MAIRITVPPVTRVLIVLLLSLSTCFFVARHRNVAAVPEDAHSAAVLYLTLVPRSCIYYPWTILTSTFVEQGLISLLVSLGSVFFGGKYLERAWGSKEFAKAILVASILPNLVVLPMYIVVGSLDDIKWDTSLSGGLSLQAAFLVAFKQLVPEHTVAIFKGLVKIRVKHFPALFLLINTTTAPILGSGSVALYAWVGLLVFWTYLRFYKRQLDLSVPMTGGPELRGDASETFAFAAFFPDKVQAPIALVGDYIYAILIALRICTPFSNEEIESGNQQAASRGEAGLPSLLNSGVRTGRQMGKREDAERRRALALQALDQRLSLANSNKPVDGQPTSTPATTSSAPISNTPEEEPVKP